MKNQRLSIRRARLSTPENQKQNPFDVIEPSSAMQSQEMPMLPAATDRKEEPEVKEVELVQYRQKPLLKKSVKDGFSSYKYTGPINQDIQYYLDDLYQREGAVSAEGLYYRLNAWNKRVDSQIEKKIPLNCVDGPISVNKDSLVLFLIMMICSTYFAISVGVTSEPDDDALKFFKSYGPGSTFIFTFYGLIFLSLPAVFAFGIAIAQILIPLFFILFDYNLIFTRDETPSLDSETLVIRIAITVPAIAWGLLYVPFWLLRKNVGRLTSHLFIAIIYVGVFLCAMGLPILRLLQSNGSFDSSFFEDNSSIIYLLSIFFIIFSWLIIHFKYFWVPTKVLEFTLMNLARRAARKPVPPHKMEQQKTVQDVNEIKVPTFKDKVFKHIYWISSVACGGAYMGIELYLLTETITAFKNDETNGFIASFFFLIASPIFLLIGIPIALSKFRVRNKSLVLPLITIVPMFGIVPLAEALTTYQAGEDLKLFFIVGPPTAIFFWLAMAFIGLKKRKIFYGIFTFSCLFLFLPFIFLGLGQSSYFEEVQTGFFGAFYALISLFSIGILILIGYLMVRYVFRFIKRKIQEAQKKREIEKAYYEKIRKIQQKRKSKIEGAKSQTEQEELDEEELDEIELDEFDHSLANIEQGGLLESARKRRSQGSLPSVAQQGGKTASGTDNKLGLSLKRSQTKTKIGSHQAEGGENAGNPGGVLSMLVIEEEKFNPEEKKRGFFGKSSKKTNTKQSMNLNILKDIELKKKLQLLSVMYLNLKNIGFWINASAFIVSYTFIAYTYFNMSISVTDTEHGILLGATIVMPVIFIINNLLIRLKTAKLSTDERRVYEKKDKMERIFFEDQLDRDEERIRTASLLEACVLLFGIFLIPIFEIPFFFIFDDRVGRTALVLIMIVCIFFSLFVAGIIELKKRSGPFHKFFVPSFISLFWVIVILPFVVIIPMVAAILVTYSDDFKVFVKLSLLGSAFLLMFGVTSFAILFNIIFQKIEKEKLIKYLIKTLSKFLKEHAVKADDVVIRRLIEEYFKKENEEELEKLKKSLIDDRIPIVPIYPPKFKVTTNYSAGLLLIDTYYQIMRKSQQLKNKGTKQKAIRAKESCWSRLARLCGDQEELDEDFEGVQDMAFDDDSYFKADNYLPEDFENRMWNYALGDFNPVQTPVVQDNGDPRMMVIDLTSKPTKDDIDFRDHMTPVLESIINIPLTSSELKNWNHNEHALILNSSLTQTEIWYQHVFDYFSGKTPPHDNNGSSQGMIYQNFIQFIRVTQLDKEKGVQPELLDSFFANFASKQIGKAHCLPYSGFIQALVETSSRVFSETLHEEKNLVIFLSLVKILTSITETIYKKDISTNHG